MFTIMAAGMGAVGPIQRRGAVTAPDGMDFTEPEASLVGRLTPNGTAVRRSRLG